MKLRILPDCPFCPDEPLVLITSKEWTAIRCRDCNWQHTFMPKPDEAELVGKIDEVVAEARNSL